MKKIISTIYSVFKVVCPEGRWWNLVYAVLGAIVTNWDDVESAINSILAALK